MPVTRDIVEAHRRPKTVMRRLLAMGPREDRALAMLMASCLIMFFAQMPFRSRQAHLEGSDLTDLLQNDLFAMIFVLPLMAYGFAAVVHLGVLAVAFLTKSLARRDVQVGDFYGARLALFWAMLASTPWIVLNGLTKGFIGDGPALTIVGAIWFAVFLWIWLSSLWEAEFP